MDPSRLTDLNAHSISTGPGAISTAPFYGLKWTRSIWDTMARWTVDPDMNVIVLTVRTALGDKFPAEPPTIRLLAQGALNKIYLIEVGNKEFIVRVTLPVDPL